MLSTPIPQIELALKGRVDFLRKTSPWGGGDEPDRGKSAPDPDVGTKLAAALRGMSRARG